MNVVPKTTLTTLMIVLAVITGCRQTLGPDEVDDSIPRPTSPNEPAGFTPVANRGFNKLLEDNWIWGGIQSSFREMQEGAAPQSGPAIARITMPQGFPAGGSPIRLERYIRLNDHLYLNVWFRLAENWKNNSIFDALLAVWGSGEPRIFVGWRTNGQGTGMYPAASVTTQLAPGGVMWLDANLAPELQVSKGGWHHLEMELESRPGATGRLIIWLDGIKIASHENVPFGLREQNRRWNMLQVGPAWGGLTEPLDRSQTFDFDHVYGSARP